MREGSEDEGQRDHRSDRIVAERESMPEYIYVQRDPAGLAAAWEERAGGVGEPADKFGEYHVTSESGRIAVGDE